jgi:hypothetical protein
MKVFNENFTNLSNQKGLLKGIFQQKTCNIWKKNQSPKNH